MKVIKTLLITIALIMTGTAFAGSWGFSLGNGAGFYVGNGGGCWGGGYGYGGGYVVPMQPYQNFYYSQPTYYYSAPPIYNYGPSFYWGNNGGGCWNGNRNNSGRNRN